MKVNSLIIFPIDPIGKKIGGIGTFLRNFIKFAPDEFQIEFVGVSSNKKERPVGIWQELELYDKSFKFLPVLYVKDENIRTKVPLSFKYTVSLFKYRSKIPLENRILEFHRIEPSFLFRNTINKKLLFIHGNMMDLYNPHTEIKWGKFPWLYFQVEKRLIGQFNKILVVREDAFMFYKKRYSSLEDRFSFLPTWVDGELFYHYTADTKQEKKVNFLYNYSLKCDTELILFVGRLEGQKDPLLLIDSFSHILKSGRNVRLLMVGDGSLKNSADERINALGIREKVLLLGIQPQNKVAELMKISDVFFLTSAFEGMPRSVLEALRCGLPVVSTDVGETKLVVKDRISGRLVAKREPKTLANAVLDILSNPKRLLTANIVSSVEPYQARKILEIIYKKHYELAGN